MGISVDKRVVCGDVGKRRVGALLTCAAPVALAALAFADPAAAQNVALPASPQSGTVPPTPSDAPVTPNAQTATGTPGGADTTSAIGDIVVTAQRRSQNLQSVPIAVTAIGGESLQVNRVTSVNDLSGLAPGLVVRDNPGSNASPLFTMRGVAASSSIPSQDKEISTYLDGVYIGGTRGASFNLPDLERIEVLRGPQGTLFGRNATAGAISAVTRDPTGEFQARQDTTAGNYQQFRTRTTIDTPQVGPFSAYVTFVHDERRGDVRNLGAGTSFNLASPFNQYGGTHGQVISPRYLGSHNNNDIFAALKFQPADNLKFVYKFDRSDSTSTPVARSTIAINPNSVIGQLLNGIIAAQPAGGSPFGPVQLTTNGRRPDAVNNGFDSEGNLIASGHSLTTTWDINNHLSLKNVSSYRQYNSFSASTILGLDGLQFNQAAVAPYARFAALSSVAGFSSFPAATQNYIVSLIGAALQPNVGNFFAPYDNFNVGFGHQYSSELQLNYNSKLLTVTAGGLYYHSNEYNGGLPSRAQSFAFVTVPYAVQFGNIFQSRSQTESYAGYVQAELHLTSQIDLVGGARLTHDSKIGSTISGGTYTNGAVNGAAVYPFTFATTRPSFSAGVNFTPRPGLLAYAKFSTAFLSGGAVGPIPFQPETVSSEEVGIKSDLFDRHVRFNLALYNAVYHHSQYSGSGTSIFINGVAQTALGVVIVDNGTTYAKGAEAELTVSPVNGVILGGSLGYNDSSVAGVNPILGYNQPFVQSGVPSVVGQGYVQYETQPLIGSATGFLRVDANYQGRYRAIPQSSIAAIPAFTNYTSVQAHLIVNGRLALRKIAIGGSADGEIAIWSRNMFNRRDINVELPFGDFNINADFQPARTFGLDVLLHFK